MGGSSGGSYDSGGNGTKAGAEAAAASSSNGVGSTNVDGTPKAPAPAATPTSMPRGALSSRTPDRTATGGRSSLGYPGALKEDGSFDVMGFTNRLLGGMGG